MEKKVNNEFLLNNKNLDCPGVPTIELWYPRNDGSAKEVEVGLMDVRAADSLRISYDFDRDGWVIKQASTFEWDGDDETCDMDWQEVAFVQAWARKKGLE